MFVQKYRPSRSWQVLAIGKTINALPTHLRGTYESLYGTAATISKDLKRANDSIIAIKNPEPDPQAPPTYRPLTLARIAAAKAIERANQNKRPAPEPVEAVIEDPPASTKRDLKAQ